MRHKASQLTANDDGENLRNRRQPSGTPKRAPAGDQQQIGPEAKQSLGLPPSRLAAEGGFSFADRHFHDQIVRDGVGMHNDLVR